MSETPDKGADKDQAPKPAEAKPAETSAPPAAAETAPKAAEPSPRRAPRTPAAAKPVQSAVPLWVYIVTVLIICGCGVALTVKFKMDKRAMMDRQRQLNDEHSLAVQKYEKQLDELFDARTKLKNQNEELGKQVATDKMEISEARAEAKQAAARTAAVEKTVEELTAVRDGLQAEVARLTDAAAKLTAAMEAETASTAGIKDELAAARTKADEETKRAAVEFNQRVAVEGERNDLRNQIKFLKEEKIPDLEAQIEELLELVPEDKRPQ